MVSLQERAISVDEVLAAARGPGEGAVALFLGTARDRSEGRAVLGLEYSAYAPMAESEMRRIEDETRSRFGVSRVAIVHRVGAIGIGEVSVAVAVASVHRREALEACRFAIDTLKRTVPIWKKELFEDGAAWVEGEEGLAAP